MARPMPGIPGMRHVDETASPSRPGLTGQGKFNLAADGLPASAPSAVRTDKGSERIRFAYPSAAWRASSCRSSAAATSSIRTGATRPRPASPP